MEIVIEQRELLRKRLTYQQEVPVTIKCRKCKSDAMLIMQVHDADHEIVAQRPSGVLVWPHDNSVTHVYLCTECGRMRAIWNQG